MFCVDGEWYEQTTTTPFGEMCEGCVEALKLDMDELHQEARNAQRPPVS